MKVAAAFLLVLSCLAISHAWNCREAPRLNNVLQIDAGQGQVVAIGRKSFAYHLAGLGWNRLSTLRFKHVTVGPAGIWAVDTSNRVYKYVAGNFVISKGLSMLQVDAGGAGQLVGVTTNSRGSCLRRSIASNFYGVGSLSWNYLSRIIRYYSCGPFGCWGTDTSYRVFVTKTLNPSTCSTSGWLQVAGASLKMVEVGADGTVFGVDRQGKVYQRLGISSYRPQGLKWTLVPMCMPISHLTYDLRRLWVTTSSGLLMLCTH